MFEDDKKYALVTVICEKFFPGTVVMLHSFLKHNPWFEGEIVILHDSLPENYQRFFTVFPGVRFVQISEVLKNRINQLCTGVPHLDLETKKQRFFSLEVLRLSGYEKLLFCDSDLLFLDCIKELFDMSENPNEPIVRAAGDLYFHTKQFVSTVTFLPEKQQNNSHVRLIEKTFNSGFMLFDGELLTQNNYLKSLELLSVARWQKIQAPRTDQIVFNLCFSESFRLLSTRYNYLILHEKAILNVEKIEPEQIKVLHFNGKPKPWNHFEVLERIAREMKLVRYCTMWNNAFAEILPDFHFKLKIKNGFDPRPVPDDRAKV